MAWASGVGGAAASSSRRRDRASGACDHEADGATTQKEPGRVQSFASRPDPTLELAGADTNVLVQNNRVIGNGSTFANGNPFQGDGINIASNENHVLNNEVHANKVNGILVRGSNFTGKRNEIRENNAADNGPPGFFRGDLVDTHQDFQFEPEFAQIFHCDENVWFGNIWGSGGFWPDAAFHDPAGGIVIESSCTTVGGHPDDGAVSRAAATGEQPPPVPDYKDLDRGHPPVPR